MPYTKLFNSIITSTLWLEPDHTRLVWITMLALADKNGEVQASVPGLAKMAGVPVDACRAALQCLSSPDPDSRTKEAEGRRIVEIDGGWELVNHAKYRRMASEEDSRQANARRQSRHRARNPKVTHSNAASLPSHDEVTPDDHKQSTEAVKADTKGSGLPSLAEFCEFYCEKLADLGEPVPLDNWLMEQHGYLASEVWPSRPPKDWRQLQGKLIGNYRSRHAEKSAKTGNGSGRYDL